MIVIFIMLVESALAVLFSCQDRGKRVSLKYDGTDDGSIISFNVVDPLPVTGRRALVIPSRQPRGILHRTIRQMAALTITLTITLKDTEMSTANLNPKP